MLTKIFLKIILFLLVQRNFNYLVRRYDGNKYVKSLRRCIIFETRFNSNDLAILENFRYCLEFLNIDQSLYRLYIPIYMYNLVLYQTENIWRD